ncbi:MAG: prolyl oligopeptidase family serine peptidase [Acidobacteria bacterium]|nr:prolyl oligopeptidase family serine peptidase [Acidobacteriota bacterium]
MLNRRLFLASLAAPLGAQQAPTVHERILQEAADAPLSMRFEGSTQAQAEAWQHRFRAKLAELLGPFQPPAFWKSSLVEAADFEDHRRELFVFEADGAPALPIWILTPKGYTGKRPGVVTLHGHGPFGHDAVAGVDTTPERKADIEKFHYDYGRELARRGYLTAAPCFTPFGRRLDDKKRYGGDDACAVSFVRLQLLGRNLMTENLRDALWAFEALRRYKNVDPERIGCVGLSYGGRMTMLTAAMEPRIRVAVPSGALNVMQERVRARYSCGAQVIPDLLQYGDVPEIAGLIAPRPAVWEVGQRDGLMVQEWTGPAWARIEKVYAAMGAAAALERDDFDGEHRWSGVKAYPLLERVLRP